MVIWCEVIIIIVVYVIFLDFKFFFDWDIIDREKFDDCNDNKLENWLWMLWMYIEINCVIFLNFFIMNFFLRID